MTIEDRIRALSPHQLWQLYKEVDRITRPCLPSPQPRSEPLPGGQPEVLK